MKQTAKWAMIASVSMVMLVTLSPVALVGHIIYRAKSKKYDLWYYFKALAVGADDLGASFIYGSKRHTISAITGAKAHAGDRWHKLQEKAINILLGDDKHCYNEAIDEGLILEVHDIIFDESGETYVMEKR